MFVKTLSVSSLNNYIKKIIDNDFILNNANVKGEISNFKLHSSGHAYFSLKDDTSKINCIMFSRYTKDLKFIPKDGMNIVVKGKVSIYGREGTYQLYCEELKIEGVGELYTQFLKLKETLKVNGYFEDKYKKDIPLYPKKIGVITSPTGAAIRDILNVLKRRNPIVEILIYPSLVQGIEAYKDVIKGIEKLNSLEDIDSIIIARGGGSIEELWNFNEEALALAIFNSSKPIITGIGHETDFTISDFVSDRRAPTPSAAAEIAVLDTKDLNNNIEESLNILKFKMINILKMKKKEVNYLNKVLSVNSPEKKLGQKYNEIRKNVEILNMKINNILSTNKQNLNKYNLLLDSLSPLNILDKGYVIIEDDNDRIISDFKKLREKDKVSIITKDGKGKFKIDYMEDKNEKGK